MRIAAMAWSAIVLRPGGLLGNIWNVSGMGAAPHVGARATWVFMRPLHGRRFALGRNESERNRLHHKTPRNLRAGSSRLAARAVNVWSEHVPANAGHFFEFEHKARGNRALASLIPPIGLPGYAEAARDGGRAVLARW